MAEMEAGQGQARQGQAGQAWKRKSSAASQSARFGRGQKAMLCGGAGESVEMQAADEESVPEDPYRADRVGLAEQMEQTDMAGPMDVAASGSLDLDLAALQLSQVRTGAGGYGTGRAEFTPDEERLLLEHLPIVRFLARRIHERLPQHVEMEDLFSAGVVGLMDAFAKFDPTKKVQFRSYAQFRIRGAILDSLRTLDWSPRELRRKGRAVEEAIRSLTGNLGRAPSEAEVAGELGVELEAYQQLLGELKGLEIGTLHVERNEDSGDEEMAYVPGRVEDDPLFRCLRGEMQERLTEAVSGLPERERLVMTLYYFEEMTMREIGLALGVVESRVSQIHASAVLHLRTALADLARRGEKRPGRSAGRAAISAPLPNAMVQRAATRAGTTISR